MKFNAKTIKLISIITVLILVIFVLLILLNRVNIEEKDCKTVSVLEDVYDDCYEDSFNCNDFCSQSDAQKMYNWCLFLNQETLDVPADNDTQNLDRDGNGIACENLDK